MFNPLKMTGAEHTVWEYVTYPMHRAIIAAYMAHRSEHVTIVGDGEDFHSSDSARALLEVGYWGTLDVESMS